MFCRLQLQPRGSTLKLVDERCRVQSSGRLVESHSKFSGLFSEAALIRTRILQKDPHCGHSCLRPTFLGQAICLKPITNQPIMLCNSIYDLLSYLLSIFFQLNSIFCRRMKQIFGTINSKFKIKLALYVRRGGYRPIPPPPFVILPT